MRYAVELILVQRPEVLERVLRVVRHRGFKLTGLNMELRSDDNLAVTIKVESERDISLLINQLTKLVDLLECHHQAV